MSVVFNGSNSYFAVPTGSHLTFGNQWSISCWAKFNGTGDIGNPIHQHWLFQRSGISFTGSSSCSIRFLESTNQFTALFTDSNNVSADCAFITGEVANSGWYHFVLLRQRNDKNNRAVTRLYVNNVLCDTDDTHDAQTGMIFNSPLFFGRRGDTTTSTVLSGQLAEWAKFDRCLSKTEITQLYNKHNPKLLSNGIPTLYFPMKNHYNDVISNIQAIGITNTAFSNDHPFTGNIYHPITTQQNTLPQLDGRVGRLEVDIQDLIAIVDTTNQSYLTGVNDIILSGIPSTGADVTLQLQNFFTNVQNNDNVRINPGIYRLSGTINIYGKHNVNIDARGATFIEINRLPSGTFWFDRCTGIIWNGGYITGADTLSYLLGIASGVEISGNGIEDLAPGIDNTNSSRKVLGQGFNLQFCKRMSFSDIRITNKYRGVCDYMSQDLTFNNLHHIGVQTGNLDNQDERKLLGTGTVDFGQYFKEGNRNSYTFHLGRTIRALFHNCRAEQCGGLMTLGTISLGAGPEGSLVGKDIVVNDCFAKNIYDNGLYSSSVDRVTVNSLRVVNDSGLPHSSIVGMKGRGEYVRFTNCYVEHVNNGYGIEGQGSVADYWTNFGGTGWSSQGCAITNCVGVDCVSNGIYLDRNNTIFPRDMLIQGNYFFNCGAGPSGRVPTGFLTSEAGDIHAVILCNDGYRAKIIDNVIENTGTFASDFGIFVGNKFVNNNYFITGAEIVNNKLLGQKVGIYLKNADYARVRNNYGEKIGAYNTHYIVESGVPTLIQTYNVKNSIFVDNIVAPTGHAYVLRTKPTGLWENNIVRDNLGEVQIN
jgi:hypothetical protein